MFARGHSLAAALALALTAANLSCATSAERIVRRSVPAGIEETLDALNDPDNQEKLRRLVDLPAVQQAARDLAENLAGGALDGLTDEARQKKVRELTDAFVRQLARAVGESLQQDISPPLTRAVEDAVGGAVAAALGPENRAQARRFVEAITRTTVATFGQSAGATLRDDLGPAMQHVIEQNLGPALEHVIADRLVPRLREALGQELVPAAGRMSREITRQAVLGAHDAFVELHVDQQLGDVFWARLEKAMHAGERAGQTILWILALVIVALGILLVRAILVRRSLERERASSERMLLSVLQAIQRGDTDDPNRPPDLDTMIARAHAEHPELAADSYIAGLIARARAAASALTGRRPPRA